MPSLPIGEDAEVPLDEIELRVSRSSGPGGQHANVTASRVEAIFDVHASQALDARAEGAHRGPARLARDAVAQDTRSQHRNRELALERLARRLAGALKVARPRTKTRPTRASQKRRVEGKRQRGEIKRARRRPDLD